MDATFFYNNTNVIDRHSSLHRKYCSTRWYVLYNMKIYVLDKYKNIVVHIKHNQKHIYLYFQTSHENHTHSINEFFG